MNPRAFFGAWFIIILCLLLTFPWSAVCVVGSLCQTILIHYCSGAFSVTYFQRPAVMKHTETHTRTSAQADWRAAASSFLKRQPACRRRHAGCLIRLPHCRQHGRAARCEQRASAPVRIHNTQNIYTKRQIAAATRDQVHTQHSRPKNVIPRITHVSISHQQ